jgi:hypothetical protein
LLYIKYLQRSLLRHTRNALAHIIDINNNNKFIIIIY